MNRKIMLYVLTAVIALAAAAALVRPRHDGSAVVATINGEPVTLEEFKNGLAANRSEVHDGGEVPLEKIKQDTLSELVKLKVPQLLAKQEGLVTDISYDARLRQWQAENKRRAKAAKNNEVIYGPVHYSQSAYDDIVNSDLTAKLRQALEQEMSFTDDELKRYYEANKERLFKTQDTIRIRKVSIAADDADAARTMREIKARIDQGQRLDAAAAGYKQAKVEDQQFDAKSAHSDRLAYPELLSKAEALEPGQVTDVVKENGLYVIAACTQRINGGYQAFDDVKAGIKKALADEQFDRLIADAIQQASVVINNSVYDRIKVKDVSNK